MPAAAGPPALSLVDCPVEFAGALERHLEIELTSLQSELERPLEFSELAIEVRCAKPSILLEVRRVPDERMTRRVDTTGAPEQTHPRLVALAAGELIYAMSTSSRAAVPPARVEPTPSQSIRPHGSAPESTRRVHALAIGTIGRVGTSTVWLGGPGIAADAALTSTLGLLASGAAGFGSSELELLRVRVLTFGASTYALIGRNGTLWRWGLGPGARFGWARLTGDPASSSLRGQSLTGICGGPGMAARGLYAPRGLPLVLSLALEGTLVTLPLKGTLDRSSELFALDGAWVSATLGVGY